MDEEAAKELSDKEKIMEHEGPIAADPTAPEEEEPMDNTDETDEIESSNLVF